MATGFFIASGQVHGWPSSSGQAEKDYTGDIRFGPRPTPSMPREPLQQILGLDSFSSCGLWAAGFTARLTSFLRLSAKKINGGGETTWPG
jgi:hypothetical protein